MCYSLPDAQNKDFIPACLVPRAGGNLISCSRAMEIVCFLGNKEGASLEEGRWVLVHSNTVIKDLHLVSVLRGH